LTESRLKIAVFIDFDNIEIGVKSTLSTPFDIGIVLEAVKERGEVVTKVAYSDWKRAGDYSRQLSQHAIRMVQRNLTPGGDKNGADINLALDALEMAFTHDHINAFVIVGGDSDFITLVEKLKQYDKKVFVVGGRQFTSLVMQKNCHEFIAYENLAGTRRGAGGGRARAGAAGGAADVDKALPIVKRALKVLADREVTPQLGLLKSTLLQLDSTFSEREYGTGTFRDFIEKVAERGLVTLRQAGRSVLVELAENNLSSLVSDQPPPSEPPPTVADAHSIDTVAETSDTVEGSKDEVAPAEVAPTEAAPPRTAPAPSPQQTADAARLASDLFAKSRQTPRWPMYIRQMRQFFRNADDTFDERKLGFPGIVDFLRACQREGLLRLDRDRQGVLRVFPGANLAKPATRPADVEREIAADSAAGYPTDAAGGDGDTVVSETRFTRVTDADTTPIIDATAVETRITAHAEEDLSVGPGNVAQPYEVIGKRTRKSATPRATTTTKKAAAKTARTPRPRKAAKATKGA
jgi:uncharacterized LabA/DUF88 family protein